jgi:hypothetical protein
MFYLTQNMKSKSMIKTELLHLMFSIHIIYVNCHFYQHILTSEVYFLIPAVIIHFCAGNQEEV